MTKVFVLMPFKEHMNAIYDEVIKPEITKYGDVFCSRADEIYTVNTIIDDIVSEIEQSDFLIADLTHKNPNVLYELGIAHCLKKPVILISQNIEDIPFDIRHRRIIEYSDNATGLSALRKSLSENVKAILEDLKDTGDSKNNFEISNSFQLDEEMKKLKEELKQLRRQKEKIDLMHRFVESAGVSFWEINTYRQLRDINDKDRGGWTISHYFDVLEVFENIDELENKKIIDDVVIPMAFLGNDERGSRAEANAAKNILAKLSVKGPFSISINEFINEKKSLENKIRQIKSSFKKAKVYQK